MTKVTAASTINCASSACTTILGVLDVRSFVSVK